MAFEKIKSTLSKAGINLKPAISNEEASALHSDLVRIVTQLKTTQNIMTDNSTVINELAVDNKDLADLLSEMKDSDTSDIMEKVLNKQEINSKEVSKLLGSFETITDTVSNVGASLDVNLGGLLDNFRPLLADTRLDIESRRKILGEVRDYAKESGVSEAQLKELQDINIDQLNFTREESENLDRVLGELTESTKDVVGKTTLTKLNKSLDSAVLTKDELSGILEKQTEGGGTFLEKFKAFPEAFSKGAGGEAKSTALVSGIDALLPGLGSMLESTGMTEKISDVLSLGSAKSVLGAGVGKVKGLFSGGGGEQKESESVPAKLDAVVDTLENMEDLQEKEKKAQKKQTDVMKDGFEDLEKEQKKTRRRAMKLGKGKGGILSSLAGGLGLGAMLKGGKGGMMKTLLKGGIGLISKNPFVAGALAIGGLAAYISKVSKKKSKPVELGGASTSDRHTRLIEAEAEKGEEERFRKIFKASSARLETEDSLKTPDLQPFEESFEKTKPPSPTPVPQVATGGDRSMKSTDRKLSVEDPYIAIANSTLFD